MKTEKNDKPVGERFQDETKYTPERIGGYGLDWSRMPPPFKNYDNPIRRVELTRPDIKTGNPDIWNALQKRRSRRSYDLSRQLEGGLLSALIWATQGVTARWGDVLFRTAPSAGGLYPVETYLFLRDVEGFDKGIYHFRPNAFDLEFIREGDFSHELAAAALDQSIVADAQATFIWSAIIVRGRWKYRQRAYRYIYLDAGHIAENLYLAAEALDLGVCAIGAFYDEAVNAIVGLDGKEETAIYLATLGLPLKEEE